MGSTWQQFYQKYIEKDVGLYFVLAGELFSSLMLVASKLLQSEDEFTAPMNTLQILLVRMTITYLGTVIYMYWAKVPEAPWGPRHIRGLLTLRGTLGCFGVAGMYYSLKYISLSDSLVILFLTPTVTTILAATILKEKISAVEIGGGIASMTGVLLIARPAFLFGNNQHYDKNVETADPGLRLIATIGALIAVICSAFVFVLIRHMGRDVDPILTVSYYASITTVFSFFGIIFTPSIHFVIPDSPRQWFYMLSIGITGFVTQFLFTTGLQREKASRTSLMMYSQIVFGLVWEYIIWRHIPNFYSWLGIAIVMGSALITIYYKPNDENEQNAGHVSLADEESQIEVQVVDVQLEDLKFKTHRSEISSVTSISVED